jgi:hypothetical protein
VWCQSIVGTLAQPQHPCPSAAKNEFYTQGSSLSFSALNRQAKRTPRTLNPSSSQSLMRSLTSDVLSEAHFRCPQK